MLPVQKELLKTFHEKKINLPAIKVYKILSGKLIARTSETSNFNMLTFKCAVKGFHVYLSCWKPQENETLTWGIYR